MTAPKEIKVYWLVKRNHWQANSYIFDFLNFAEDKLQKIKKEHPKNDVEIKELVSKSDHDSQVQALKADLERLVKEYSARDASENNLAREIGKKWGISYE